MKIKDVFERDVTRDIPPVVYFHEQNPEKLKDEVGEYIITGGFPESDPRARRVGEGIHEQFVKLLKGIAAELKKPSGPELPASWISGFYGSGKSIFAKLLGLALDGKLLPDGTPLVKGLLRRDDSPKANEFVEAWEKVVSQIDPIAVVFDIGGVARDNEHIHVAALRQIQLRLGYCPDDLVAEYELKLEHDGQFEDFLKAAEKTLGKPWDEAKHDQMADDHFSHVLHELMPERYPETTTWFDSHAGGRRGIGSSVEEVTKAIQLMMQRRAPGKTLFIVVDEVSQYTHQDDQRMLKLASFVCELGQRMKGGAWLFATGQQKLEEGGDTSIGKMKDRFPIPLRVHLHATNIRDVVHKRLLKKARDKEPILRKLFQDHRSDLKLHGYDCGEITEEDFLEVYPLVPGHVDLLLQITSSLRTRSTRVKGDDYAIRGLLQLMGELFREQRLAEKEVGDLVTLDSIFEVQQSALEADIQTALTRIFNHLEFRNDDLAIRCSKAVALLQLIQETTPTTAELVAKCLYERLGQGNGKDDVTKALERLRNEGLLSYSEKYGYKIQSSVGQEWQRERDSLGVTPDQRSELVQDKLKDLIGTAELPRMKGRSFPYSAFYSDGRQAIDVRLKDPHTDATVAVDFRYYVKKQERDSTEWVQKSDQDALRDRILWICGDTGQIEQTAKDLANSRHMIKRHETRLSSLPDNKKSLFYEEKTRCEGLEKKMMEIVTDIFMDGTIYLRGRQIRPRDLSASFANVLNQVGNQALPQLYPHFTEIAITDLELKQLLEKTLAGPSTKFMDKGLGILSLDSGRYMPTCDGAVPTRIFEYIEKDNGASGSTLISYFGKPPYGYPIDVIKACLAGLLRASKIRVRPEEGPEITSVLDPGTQDLFRLDRSLRRADFFPAKTSEVGPHDRVKIRHLFKDFLGVEIDPENDAIADAVFQQFPAKRERLRDVETLFNKLPGRPELPAALTNLGKALEDCRRSRQVLETVIAVKKNLDTLRDGLEQLGIYHSELTEDAINAVRDAAGMRENQIAQLEEFGEDGEIIEEAKKVKDHLALDRPWREIRTLDPFLEKIRSHYVEVRKSLLISQGARAEDARNRVKIRSGFDRLDADQSHLVLRPIAEASFDTTEEAIAPTLVDLRDRFAGRLAQAEEESNERLDHELAKMDEKEVVRFDSRIRGREISSPEELQVLLKELEERINELLEKGARVRIF